MCLITIKPKGVAVNEHFYDIVAAGAVGNSHGSGFMWQKGGKGQILIDKGYNGKDMSRMIKAIKNLNISEGDHLVVHNRYGTSGMRTIINCHPFPITADKSLLEAGTILTELPCIVHNGIISEFDKKGPLSDTHLFVKEFLAPTKIMDDKRAIEWLGKRIGWNRLAILHPKFGLIRVGDFEKDDKFYVSNKSYSCSYNNHSADPTGLKNKLIPLFPTDEGAAAYD